MTIYGNRGIVSTTKQYRTYGGFKMGIINFMIGGVVVAIYTAILHGIYTIDY